MLLIVFRLSLAAATQSQGETILRQLRNSDSYSQVKRLNFVDFLSRMVKKQLFFS